MVSASELKKLKVSELRDELAKRALDTKGVKDDLIARLANAMEGEDAVAKQSSAAKGAVVPASVPSSGAADLLAAEVRTENLALKFNSCNGLQDKLHLL